MRHSKGIRMTKEIGKSFDKYPNFNERAVACRNQLKELSCYIP